jgi:hypothetical protein
MVDISVEVFKPETHPRQWQINKEDMEKSSELLKVDLSNSINPILDLAKWT